jgi:hypothetical protein
MGDSMSTIINATTTNGVVIQPDNSGSLELQTNSGTTALTIDTSQRAAFVAGTAALPAITTTGDTNTGMFFPAADTIAFTEGGTEAMRLDASGNVGIGATPKAWATDIGLKALQISSTGCLYNYAFGGNNFTTVTDNSFLDSGGSPTYITTNTASQYVQSAGTHRWSNVASGTAGDAITFVERMRIDSSGNVLVGKTSSGVPNAGAELLSVGVARFTVSNGTPVELNRLGNDGDLIDFYQATVKEGSISVSGTTVSYNGGHLSRWSQWQNETGKPEVYRGTVLDSVDAMCVWEKDGEPLPNEQATKTIISTTPSSKAVAGVFDRYDEDDKTNPYDFYVAQSGDFVIRIAQGVTVQNGDLLESAGDGTARPQADDICRSSTIAKVTSNYVSATYEDGSYCVPCILMIG